MALHATIAERDWLSTTEASRELGVHPDTLRRWADAGDIAAFVTPGNHRRFARGVVRRFAGAARPALDPTERLVLEYRRSGDRATRSRLLRIAQRRGDVLGRDARAARRSLGEAIALVLAVRSRIVEDIDGPRAAEHLRDANAVFDRVLVGLAASRTPPAPR